ncbi:protein SOB FIVE-LIKE 1-like [Solanum dulcamara]|uniref:protein SOB FIVE-LIKE 1-like n=1 Tax=Solanum dulcamara TaxID=45834 RepID=UPI0024866837|nr:protein SOB FIVE-LIKE 1-like [Solanum dulcamara]
MEYPKHPGGTEECNSNESGWTMYIGSPYLDYNQGGDDDDNDNDVDDDERSTPRKGYKYANDHVEDGGSDDSMTSDASSGPSHQGVLCTNIEQIYGKHVENDIRKYSSKEQQQQQKQAKKKLSDKDTKAAKEDSGHNAKSGKGYGYYRSTTRGKHVN